MWYAEIGAAARERYAEDRRSRSRLARAEPKVSDDEDATSATNPAQVIFGRSSFLRCVERRSRRSLGTGSVSMAQEVLASKEGGRALA